MNKNIFKSVGIMFLLLLVAMSTLSCSRPEKDKRIRIGTNIWPGYECLYLAEDLGYYDDTNIDPILFPSSSEAMRAYRNREVEAAALTFDEVLYLASSVDEALQPRVVPPRRPRRRPP